MVNKINQEGEVKVETEIKNYKYIIRLKQPRTYVDKQGMEKTFDCYFVTEYSQAEMFPNSIVMLIENQGGTRKITINKDSIDTIDEIIA